MKKTLSILTIVMLAILSSVVFVGCKDKNKNISLTVQYLQQVTTEGEEYDLTSTYGESETVTTLYWKWVDVDYENGLDFVLGDVNKTNSTHDYYSLICRVVVEGAKKKVDHLSVSCTASSAVQIVNSTGSTGDYEGLSVKPEEQFTVRVYTTGSINMFVVPSVKADKASVEFPINLYDEIGSISASATTYPAVAKGDNLYLSKVKDLLSFVGANGGVTNQLEVSYSLEGEGVSADGNGLYTIGSGDEAIVLDTRENLNRLTVGRTSKLSSIKIVATSLYKEEIRCNFDVKIVDNVDVNSLSVNYATKLTDNSSTNNNEKLTTAEPITLYSGNANYNKSYLVLSGLPNNEVYNFVSPDVKYEVKLYLDGKEVKANGEIYHGVSINEITLPEEGVSLAEITDGKLASEVEVNAKYHKMYSITATEYNSSTINDLKLVIGYKNLQFSSKDFSLSFTGQDKSVLVYDLKIQREDLPTAVSINSQNLKDGDKIAGTIFTSYPNGGGYELNVNAIRSLEKKTEILLKIESNSGTRSVYLYNFNGSNVDIAQNAWINADATTSSCYKWEAFSKNMYLKFDEADKKNAPESITLKFRVLASPLEFNGEEVKEKEYIEVELKLTTQGSLTSVDTSTGAGTGVTGDLFDDPSENQYIHAETVLSTIINLGSDGNIAVAPATVDISSQNSSILFSKNGVDWAYTINCGELSNGFVYFKAENGAKDRIVVTSKNGASFNSCELQFVKTITTSDAVDFELDFEKTYIFDAWESYAKEYNKDKADGELLNGEYQLDYAIEGENNIRGYYLAMQAGTNVDFEVDYKVNNATNNVGIATVTAVGLTYSELTALNKEISAYAKDALAITNFTDGKGFNLKVNKSDFATVVRVCISYYQDTNDGIEKKEYLLYIEVSTYTPVNSIFATENSSEVYYVNSRIMDKVSVKFNLSVNANASKYLYFSYQLQTKYNNSKNNNTGYAYALKGRVYPKTGSSEIDAKISGNIENSSLFIDLSTSYLQLELNKQPITDEFYVEFTAYQFDMANPTISLTKTIKVVDFEKVEDIKITQTLNYNLYLALRGEENKTSFTASVSNVNATYKTLDYQLFNYSEVANGHVGSRIYGSDKISVKFSYDENKVSVSAQGNSGGKYILRIVSPDSFSDETLLYSVYKDVVITVSDGTVDNPFYLRTLNDVETMFSTENKENEKNYILANDIILSNLDTSLERNFAGNLNGVFEYYDPEKELTIYTQNKFTRLTVTTNGGLINENTGTLSNIVIDEVTFNVELGSTAYNKSITLGSLVDENKGKINNCSVYIKNSNVNINVKQGDNSEDESASFEYNIGGLVGKNSGNISFYPDDTNNYKQYSNHLQMVTFKGDFIVDIEYLPSTNVDHNINIGGVTGQNVGEILGNYFNTNKQFNQILTANVDVIVNFNSYIDEQEEYAINVGGIAGLNITGEISQVAVTGSVMANGNNINLGAIAGNNNAEIKDSASYSTVVKGGAYKSSNNSIQTTIINQNVGGAVGLSSGNITNVYVLFIDLKTFGYGEEANPIVEGMDVVAGLVGKQTGGKISFGNVQSFVSSDVIVTNFADNENPEENVSKPTKAVAGLVAVKDDGTIEKSYVRANIKLNEAEANAENITINPIASSFENCYFIGRISQNILDANKDDIINTTASVNNSVPENSYLLISDIEDYFEKTADSVAETGKTYYDNHGVEQAVVVGETAVVDYYEKLNGEVGCLYNNSNVVAYRFTALDGNKYFASPANNALMSIYNEKKFFITGTTTVTFGDFNDGTIWTTKYQAENINDRLPVLLNDDKLSLIALAEELMVNPNANEFNPTVNSTKVEINNNGIYLTGYAGERTVIVYLSNNATNNRYKLIDNNDNGLLDKTIYPTVASGEYFLEVLDGHNCFNLIGDYITFKNTGRVELKFTSIYNTNAYDTVIFFVEQGVTDFEIVKQDNVITSLRTHTNSNLSINIRGLFEGAISNISANNLYLEISGNGDIIDIIDLSSFSAPDGYYSIENLQLNIGSITNKNETINLTFKLYLNTENYKINDNTTLNDYKFSYLIKTSDTTIDKNKTYYNANGNIVTNPISKDIDLYYELETDNNILIASKDLEVNIYQSASSLRVTNGSNKTYSVQSIVATELEILTDYLAGNDTVETAFKDYKIDDDLLYVELGDKESFYVKMQTTSSELLEFKKSSSIWNLFEYSGSYKLNGDKTGYVYTFNLELKEEYRKVSTNSKVTLTFYAKSNNIHTDVVEIIFQPQSIETFRMENFKSGVAYLQGDNVTVEYVSNETSSSIIVPGKSGLIKLYVQPSYSLVDKIEISSDVVEINGQSYVVRFQQMLYDQRTENYISYPGYTTEENTLTLQKNSYIDSAGEIHYSGIIYVRTILDDVVGSTKTFKITANAYEYERDENGEYNAVNPIIKNTYTAEKKLLSQYNPGVTTSVSNALEGVIDKELQLTSDTTAQAGKTYYNIDGVEQEVSEGQTLTGDYYELASVNRKVYLIEKNSNTTKLYARIYGYEFNQQPAVSVTNLDGESVLGKVYYSQGNGVLQSDGSYLVEYSIKTVELDEAFKLTIALNLILDGVSVDSKPVEMIFYPVDYIPTGVYLRGSSNNVLKLAVNSIKKLEMVMTSNNLTISDEANKNVNKLDYFYINKYKDGSVVSETLEAKEYEAYNFEIETSDYVTIKALGENYQAINFYVGYSFEYDAVNKNFNIVFSDKNSAHDYHLNTTFSVDLCVVTTEEEPDTIYTAEEFLAMETGGNYILMSDITLENWTPKLADFASLDGNNKLIKIKSFNIPTSQTEIVGGLFTTISADTIIKNLAIDLSDYQGTLLDNIILLADANSTATATYFGFLAGKNEGLVYNCEILCLIGSTANLKTITIETSTTNTYIGGLVGLNSGNITNSRVGTEYFEKITVKAGGSTTSEIIKARQLNIYANGIVAGFVANNSGIISSSYFANFNLFNKNKIASDSVNMTSGFVAINSGRINTSYSKGSGISSENIRGTNSGVYAIGAGSASGFVFNNTGTIENCYSNLVVSSSASAVAGFVYRNTGVISQAYSASKVTSTSTTTSLATELPFVGVGIEGDEVNKLLSNGELNNCYYLEILGTNGDNFDDNFEYTSDMDLPIALSETNFALADNLINFAFVDGSYEQNLQGVWTHYSTIDRNTESYKLGRTYLPELTSANQIARSVRYLELSTNPEIEHEIFYAINYDLGTKNNPYIIRSAEEYNSIFSISTSQNTNKFNGYIRFIDDISFELAGEEATSVINTTLGYALGDSENRNLTVVDGNGMSISGVDTRNNEVEKLDSLGLFNDIYYSIVKSLNINFVSMSYSSTRATYSGGLAGTINDSYIIGVNLIGNDTTITARNFGGGLAGIVRGESGLYNINSNLSVNVINESLSNYYQYLSYEEFEKHYTELGFRYDAVGVEARYNEYLQELSYAGGLAGVIDIESEDKVTVNKITIGAETDMTVVGDIAGFVTGHLSRSTNASRLNAVVKPSSYVFGAYISAGLVAENYGRISYSQVASEDDLQFAYDAVISQYAITPTESGIDNSSGSYGNLSFVRGETKISSETNVAGGFVGVNYGGYIDNSYTKGAISANAYYIGGFAGVNYGGIYDSVYAQNYIDLNSTYEKQEYIGGFTALNGLKNKTNNLSKVYTILDYNSSTDNGMLVDNLVVANFYDQAQLKTIANENEASSTGETLRVDYMVARSENKISSAQGENTTSMYSYYLSYSNLTNGIYNKVIKKKTEIEGGKTNFDLVCEAKAIQDLYDLQNEKQLEVFTSLFINYDINIWEKDNTKFFPTLKENPLLNYYEINSESDLILIVLHPDANFIINGDVSLANEYVNYVVNTEFTGTLTGRVSNNGAPTISGIRICTDSNTESAGFFKSTSSATITNVNFSYEYLIVDNLTGKDQSKDFVGLLSAEDKGSEFNSVSITVSNQEPSVDYHTNSKSISIDDDCYIRTAGNTIIENFGGLFGKSSGSKITGCKVEANFNINVGATSESATTKNIGGLIADFSSSNNGEIDGLILNSSYKGDIAVSGDSTTNVGSILGKSYEVNITNVNSEATITATLSNSQLAYVGGIVGYQQDSYLYDVASSLTVSAGGTQVIGGIAGYLQNSGINNDENINNSTAILNMDENSSFTNVIVGGLVGQGSSTVKLFNSVAWVYGTIESESITFGGLIAEFSSSSYGLLYIDSCFALMEEAKVNANGVDASGLKLNSSNITAGGFVGKVEGSKAIVNITKSFNAGALWASSDTGSTLNLAGMIANWQPTINNGNAIDINLKSSIAISENNSYSTAISDSYTALALDYSKFKLISSGVNKTTSIVSSELNYSVSAIIARIEQYQNTISTYNVFYSSDYSLALEEHEKYFDNMPINLVARALVDNDEKQKNFTADKGWEQTSFGLPYLTSLTTCLENMKVDGESLLNRFKNSGSVLHPVVISSKEFKDSDDSNYRYYFINTALTDEEKNNFTLSGNLKGFVLGNGLELSTSDNSSVNLLENSVISNLKYTLTGSKIIEKLNNGGIVGTNNGTIFNVTVDYYHKTSSKNSSRPTITKGGGIATTNNGNILYCYNTGSFENIGTISAFGGITATNTGFIAHSGFIGAGTSYAGADKVEFGGITYSNEGVIYNSYSAGVFDIKEHDISDIAYTFVVKNDGSLVNCYYDKYANAEFIETGSTLIAVTTEELQVKSTDSYILKGNWEIYPIDTYDTKIKDSNNNELALDSGKYEYYNYGYPMYSIAQTYYSKEAGESEYKETKLTVLDKALYTGNGTKESPYLISNIGTLNSINNIDAFGELTNADGTKFTDTSKMYFKLINDIDFNKCSYNGNDDNIDTGICGNWTGLGKNNAFTNVFYSGDRQSFEKSIAESIRTISNITGGLFDQLGGGAKIYNLAFSSAEIKSGGVLANTVANNSETLVVKNVLFGKVKINDKLTTSGKFIIGSSAGKAGNAGLVFGSVNGDAEVNSFNVLSDDISYDNFEAGQSLSFILSGSADNLGTIAGVVNSGATLAVTNSTIGGASDTMIGINYDEEKESGEDYGSDSTNVGGIVGSVSGTLNLNNTKVGACYIGATNNAGGIVGMITGGDGDSTGTINIKADSDIELISADTIILGFGGATNAGGVVGNLSGELNFSTANITINASLGYTTNNDIDATKPYPNNAGGIAGVLSRTISLDSQATGNSNNTSNSKIKVNVKGIRAKLNAGGVVGSMSNGTISGIEVNFNASGDRNYFATTIAGVAGSMQAGEISNVSVSGDIEAINTTNLAGAIGIAGTTSSSEDNASSIIVSNFESSIGSLISKNDSSITETTIAESGVLAGFIGKLNSGNSLTLQETISVSGSLAGNSKMSDGAVGGFIGYMETSKITESDDLTLTINMSEISGYKNVGGLIGKFSSTSPLEVGEGLANYLGGEEAKEFAKISFPTEDGQDADISNVGGIFGYYNCPYFGYNLATESSEDSSADSSGETDGETISSAKYIFKNANPVLTEADKAKNYKLSASKKVSNVGGIAGYAQTNEIRGENIVQIGCGVDDYFDMAQEDFSKAENVINLQYVGGIIGKIEQVSSEDTATDTITVSEAKNSGKVIGYKNVGGLTSNINIPTLTVTLKSGEGNTSDIAGCENVGGLFGEVKVETSLTIDAISSIGKVSGRKYVGGVIGNFSTTSNETTNKITISKFGANDAVSGLINVGGVLGATSSEIEIAKSTEESADETLTIAIIGNTNVGGMIGVVSTTDMQIVKFTNIKLNLNMTTKVYNWGKDKDNDNAEVNYMPTSVGGFVGVGGSINISGCEISGKIYEEESSSNSEGTGLSMLYNYVLGASDRDSVTNVNNVSQDRIEYDYTYTGIGGLMGTLKDYNGYTDLAVASMKVNIYQPNGMNVGGIVGFWNYNSAKKIVTDIEGNETTEYTYIELPTAGFGGTESEKIYIAGGMGVGAYVGRIYGGSSTSPIDVFSEKEITLNNIVLQERHPDDIATGEKTEAFGQFVGAVAGVSTSTEAIRLSASSNIQINNSEGQYYGGLIGKLDGSLTGHETDNGQTFYSSVPDNIFTKSDNYNYGGLAGLLQTENTTVNALGNHNYAFTVDTLRTANVTTDQKSLYLDETNQNVNITAHINNNSDILVAYSNKVPSQNPVNTTCSGWHQDYTMFRTSEVTYNKADAETIVNIYDAKNVNAVGRGGGVAGEIVYTLYNIGNQELLYTKYGIASYLCDNINAEVYQKYLAVKVGAATWDDLIKATANATLTCTAVLTGTSIINDIETHLNKFRSMKVCQYLIAHPNDLIYENNSGAKLLNSLDVEFLIGIVNGKVYVFDTVYGKTSDDDCYSILNNTSGMDEDDFVCLPISSGSLFEVTGTISNRMPAQIDFDKNGANIFAMIFGGIMVAAGIGLLFVPGGQAAGAGILAMFFGGMFATVGIWGAAVQIPKSIQRKSFTVQYILNQHEGEYGLIGNIYSKPWYIENNELIGFDDDYILVNVTPTDSSGATASDRAGLLAFNYYSQSKPKDYGETITLASDHLPDATTPAGYYVAKEGDVLPKYSYYNGSFYLNSYYVEGYEKVIIHQTDAVEKITSETQYLYWEYIDNQYYVIDSAHWADSNYDGGLDTGKLLDSNNITKTRYYRFDSSIGNNPGDAEGVDYVQFEFKDLAWMEIDYSTKEECELSGVPVLELYCNDNWKYYKPINDDAGLYPTTNVVESYTYYYDENMDRYDFVFYDANKNAIDAKTIPVKFGDDIYQNILDKNSNKTVYLHYTTEEKDSYYKQDFMYKPYDTSFTDNLITPEGYEVPFAPLDSRQAQAVYVYDANGNMSVLSSHTSTDGLYLIDVSDMAEDQKALYALSNYFVYQNNQWYQAQTNYTTEILNGIEYIAQMVPQDTAETRARRKQNKCYITIGNLTIYTRYNFNSGSWQTYSYEDDKWASASENDHSLEYVLGHDSNGAETTLLTTSNGFAVGYEGYYLSETAMFSYNNSKGSLTGWTE